MKPKDTKPAFGADHLVKKIDDLRGVEPGELSRHFSRSRMRRARASSAERRDPPRIRAMEGLGLERGRRFFKKN
jgi:hypothetical protein